MAGGFGSTVNHMCPGYCESTTMIRLYKGYMYLDSSKVGQKPHYWVAETDDQPMEGLFEIPKVLKRKEEWI